MKDALEMLSYRNVLSAEAVTALYCRLSVDDQGGGDEDSNSIQHQKEMLLAYCKANGYINIRVYVDDGYSGTNFERPDFKRMIADIEAGEVKRVIIKDMSRLGRDYLQVGMFTEVFFQEHDVHFIAISDGVDSQKGDNELTPFRNLFNEWYARDCSKKQRAVKRMKGMSGQRVATQIPYGYLKGENGKLVVDPETAPVVKLIFDLCLQGYGPTQIARLLTEKGISPRRAPSRLSGPSASSTTTRRRFANGLRTPSPKSWPGRSTWGTRSTLNAAPSLISPKSASTSQRTSRW